MAAPHAVAHSDDGLCDLASEVVDHEEQIARMVIPGGWDAC